MAKDSILKLDVESSSYNAKLKEATQGLLHLAEVAHKSDGELTGLSESELAFVKGLGDMETKSRTAAGSVRELENSYKELKVIYDQLNETEKQDEGGKALAASLDQIKQRAKEARQQLDNASKSLNDNSEAGKGTSGILDELSSKFGISMKSVLSWGSAIGAAKVALDVAKDAFFASEDNIDEWGRTVEGAKGAYNLFLNALNTGNWSNFFSNLETAVNGARDLYDALDRLGSIKANNQAAIAIVQQQIAQLRLMKSQGQNVDDQLKAATERLRQLQNQAVEAGKYAGHMGIKNTIRDYANTINTTGVKVSEGMIAGAAGAIENQGQAAVDRYTKDYNELRKKGMKTVKKSYSTSAGTSYSTTKEEFDLSLLTKSEQQRYLISEAIKKKETEIQKYISTYAQAVQEGTSAAREEFKGNRYALQGTKGGKGGSGSGTSPKEQAQKQVEAALLAYNQTVEKAKLEMESGLKSEADMKKTLLSAQEQLWTAYGKAYATYADPKYKEAQDAAAAEIVKLGGEVKTATEAQKAAEQAAREQEAAAKKLAADQEKLANTYAEAATAAADNNLKGFLAANKKAEGMGGTAVEMPLTFTATSSNIDAFIGSLKEQLSTADVGSELANKLTSQMADATAMKNVIEMAMKSGIDMSVIDPSGLWKKVFTDNPGDYIEDSTWTALQQTINKKLQEMGIEPIKIDLQTGNLTQAGNDVKSVAGNFRDASSAISAVGNALNSIEDPGVKVAGIVAQAIGTVASAFAGALASDGSTKSNIWAFIAAAAASTASMITMIDSIHSATGYANGGIVDGRAGGFVGGTSYSGDNIGNVRLNSGELVLNTAQQDNVAAAINSSPLGDLQLETILDGEDIKFALNANGRRTMKGEFVQSKNYG